MVGLCLNRRESILNAFQKAATGRSFLRRWRAPAGHFTKRSLQLFNALFLGSY